jgi:hypothetical protein
MEESCASARDNVPGGGEGEGAGIKEKEKEKQVDGEVEGGMLT